MNFKNKVRVIEEAKLDRGHEWKKVATSVLHEDKIDVIQTMSFKRDSKSVQGVASHVGNDNAVDVATTCNSGSDFIDKIEVENMGNDLDS